LEIKDLSEFYSHPFMADGHLNKCKTCARADVRQHRSENDSVREYDRSRHAVNEDRQVANFLRTMTWRKDNPEAYKAHNKVAYEIKIGRLIRQPCRVCGEKGHAHHADYSKPLEIDWLCPRHHHLLHAPDKMIKE